MPTVLDTANPHEWEGSNGQAFWANRKVGMLLLCSRRSDTSRLADWAGWDWTTRRDYFRQADSEAVSDIEPEPGGQEGSSEAL